MLNTVLTRPADAGVEVFRGGFGTETDMDRLPCQLGHGPCKRLRARDRGQARAGR
jgi:hypothetical protein